MASITLPRAIINQLLAQAQASPETEVCGLISGREGRAIRSYPVPNAAETPQQRFFMDPQGLINAMRAMRENDESLFAIYHSHPHTPARPSRQDLQQAAYPEAYYLIISLATEGTLQLRAFQLQGDKWLSLGLILE
jgi:proteasome lid subunit RPN8/RPN11